MASVLFKTGPEENHAKLPSVIRNNQIMRVELNAFKVLAATSDLITDLIAS